MDPFLEYCQILSLFIEPNFVSECTKRMTSISFAEARNGLPVLTPLMPLGYTSLCKFHEIESTGMFK